jgi:hypothetical protein
MGTAATLVPLSYSNLGTTGTLTVANTGGTRGDTLVYNGTAANNVFTVDAQEAFLNNQIDVLTPGVSTLTLNGLAGNSTYDISDVDGTLPYTAINVNGSGDPTLNLSGATGAVTVNLADNTPGSANPNTTITGYGGTVTLSGVDTANLNTNGNSLLVNGTSLDDNTTYTPTGASAGTFTNSGLSTVFNFAGDTSAFTISGQGGTANQVTVDTPAGSATVREVARVVTVTPIGSAALEPVTLAADVQIVNLIGGGGPDTFQVTPAAGTQYAGDGNLDNLVVNVAGSATGASSALVIESAAGGTLATNQSVLLIKGPILNSGTVRTFTAGVQWPDINYTNIQTVLPKVAAGPAGQTGVTATESNTTVTITTPSANGLQQGNSVTISGFTGGGAPYNGTWVITSILSPTMFTYTDTVTGLPNATGGSEVPASTNPLGTAGPEINGVSISGQTGVSVSESSTNVTITTPSANGLQQGNSVTISGFTGAAAGYNGTFAILSVLTPTTFSYADTVTGLPNATGGSEVPNYSLFALSPQNFTQGPTPYLYSLTINVVDLAAPNGALDIAADNNPGLYTVVGDQTGNAPISQVIVTDNPVVTGQPATATVQLMFAQPLLDDRYTLTINDNVVDPAGNQLDGASNASDPIGPPTFPSGSNGLPASFVASFTVDSRPHIGAYLTGQGGQQGTGGQQQLDINGNGIWDPVNAVDAVNSDKAFTFATSTDMLFSGNFAPAGQSGTGFDELGAFGEVNGVWRWILTFNNVAQPDYSAVSILQLKNPIPVAGHFNPNINADEIALFDGNGNWYIDYNHTNNVGGPGTVEVSDGLQGLPVVGDFDGSGHIEFATYQPAEELWTFDLNPFGVHNIVTLQWGFPPNKSNMVDPVAADMNGDGVTDIGLYVPKTGSPDSGSQTTTSFQSADWYWLVSEGTPVVGTISTLAHAFNPSPFSNDLYFSFGNGNDLPLVGHWDPKLPAQTPTPWPTPTPTPTRGVSTPTLEFVPGTATTVLGTTYATARQLRFVGTAAPGVTVDLILSGSHLAGRTRIVRTVVTNSAGGFSFRLPASIKNGSYTLEARALSPSASSYELSIPVAFKVGPAPHIKPAKPAKPTSTKPVKAKMSTRTTVQVHPRALEAPRVVATSGSNGHLVDQAVHTLVVENRLFKKKGH